MRRFRRVLSTFVAFTALACVARADVTPQLRTSWEEKHARVEAFSRDGRFLVSAGGDGYQLRDSRTGQVRAVLATRPQQFEGPEFSPDGRLLFAMVSSDRHKPVPTYDLKVWDVASGAEHATFAYVSDNIHRVSSHFALSGDGKTLVFVDNSERLPMRVKTGKIITFPR